MAKKQIEKKPAPAEDKLSAYSPILLVLPLIWGGIVLYNNLKVYPVNPNFIGNFLSSDPEFGIASFFYLFSYFKEIGVAALMLVSAYGIGRFIAGAFKLVFDPAEEFVFSSAIGLTAVIYFTLLCGSLSLLYKLPLAALLLAGLFAAFREFMANKAKFKLNLSLSKTSFLVKILGLIAFVVFLFVLIGALSPETFYDSMKYHLGVPKYWLMHNNTHPIQNFEYSYYPVNIHLLYTVALMFGNEITAKMIHFMFGALTSLLIYQWCKKNFTKETGVASVFIFVTIPLVPVVMWKTSIELGLAFFETLAALSFVYYLTCAEGEKKQWMILAAVFCGTAMGGKYLSIYSLISISAVFIIYQAVKKADIKKIILNTGILATLAIIFVLPYLIRNYVSTGVMTYPYQFSFKSDVTALMREKPLLLADPGIPDRSFKYFSTLPWEIAMGRKTQEPFSGAILLLCLPLPFLFRKTDKKIKLLAYYCLAYYLCWFLVRTYFRYLVPLTPTLGIVFAYYIIAGISRSKFAKSLFMVMLLILGLSSLTFTTQILRGSMDPLRVVFGHQSKRDYLFTQRQSYPSPYYGVIDWANNNLPKDSTILFLGECRGFHSERKFITYTLSDYCPLIQWTDKCRNADDLYAVTKEKGVTHILLNMSEGTRLAVYDGLHFEAGELRIFAQFWQKYVKEIYRDIGDISIPQQGISSMKTQQPEWWAGYSSNPNNYVYLYEIMTVEDAVKPHQPPRNFFLEPQLYSKERWLKIQEGWNTSK
ncbi:MAG: glycosyltransferase family 39 protein [Elusimicrobiota bacterium]